MKNGPANESPRFLDPTKASRIILFTPLNVSLLLSPPVKSAPCHLPPSPVSLRTAGEERGARTEKPEMFYNLWARRKQNCHSI